MDVASVSRAVRGVQLPRTRGRAGPGSPLGQAAGCFEVRAASNHMQPSQPSRPHTSHTGLVGLHVGNQTRP